MNQLLRDHVVAVTGAGRGIGRAVALHCAEHGSSVVVNDVGVAVQGGAPNTSVAESVVEEIRSAGGSAVSNVDSVTTMSGGQRIVDTALDSFGRLDGVVCVAGILRERMLFNMSEEEWDPVIEAHLKGTFTVFRAAAAHMRRQRAGRLVGFTSGNHIGSAAQANYSAAKGGIISLVRSAALAMHKYGVTANAVAPIARTRMSTNVPTTLPNLGEPEDVAPLVVYLLSDEAAELTGQVYTAAGGKIAVWAQPREIRAMFTKGRWTAEEIAERLPETVGQSPMSMFAETAARARAVGEGKRPNA